LLGSLATPTPVSALMHGGFVNAGGLLLIRFGPVLETAPVVQAAAVTLGLSAAVYGILLMSVRPDIKGSLAASTVSQMGFMVASCGLGLYAAALWHLAAHGLFKAWLFLTAGSRIGIEQNRPQAEVTATSAATIALMTLAGGATALATTGEAPLPLLLAAATGVAAIVSTRGFALLAVGSTLFVAGSIAIAELLGKVMLPSGSSPVSAPGQFIIAAAFLGAWVYQQSRRSTALPPRLFVHLLNAATITPSSAGAKA
jgi:NADH:ubiquinone oxidoreductase subunit 5 (subunit L)/multisubunit Na+/H+ antiporter MnhA subunit